MKKRPQMTKFTENESFISYYYFPLKTKKTSLSLSALRKEGLEPSRSKAITGSLVLRVCQFRHFRCSLTTYKIISTYLLAVNTIFHIFSRKLKFFQYMIEDQFQSIWHVPHL